MGLDEMWDWIVDELDYLIHFEWISDIGDFFSGLFENLSEISIAGLIFGAISIFLTNMVLKKLDYINSLPIIAKTINYVIFFALSFVITYIMVKRAWDM